MAREEALIARITSILLSGRSPAVTRAALRKTLAPVAAQAVDAAYDLARRFPRAFVPPRRTRAPGELARPVLAESRDAVGLASAATTVTRENLMAYRAAFLLASARRIHQAIKNRPSGETIPAAVKRALRREKTLFAAHRTMQNKRIIVARSVDLAAAVYGRRLGWWAVNHTHGEPCARAHGKDFYAEQPPIIDGRRAYPGAAHPGCKCRPGPPFHTELLPGTSQRPSSSARPRR